MADSIGEFALNHTGSAYLKNGDGVVVAYVNYEGTATGYGTVMGTMCFQLPEGGATSGTCSWTAQGFPPDSAWSTSTGDGTWKQVEGKFAWKVDLPVVEISNGTRIRTEGELDLEARTLTGLMFEAS